MSIQQHESRRESLGEDPGGIFLSYNHVDAQRVQPIAAILESRGLNIWLDQVKIEAGGDIFDRINKGLATSKVFIAFAGKHYFVNGKFTTHEFSAAFHLAGSVPDWRIIIVKLDAEVEIPPLVAGRLYIEYSDTEHTAEALLSAIQRFEAVDGAAYGVQRSLAPINNESVDFNELSDSDVDILGRNMLERRLELLREQDNILTFEIRLPKARLVRIEVLRDLVDDDGLFFQLDDYLKDIDISQRYISKVREKLRRGLAGEYEVGFEMLLEDNEAKRDTARKALRQFFFEIAEKAVLHRG
jgi:hypothetical protein